VYGRIIVSDSGLKIISSTSSRFRVPAVGSNAAWRSSISPLRCNLKRDDLILSRKGAGIVSSKFAVVMNITCDGSKAPPDSDAGIQILLRDQHSSAPCRITVEIEAYHIVKHKKQVAILLA
jgi:hypothetical protein